MKDESELLSIGVLARRLGVSRQSIANWEAAHRIPPGMRLNDGRPGGMRVWRVSDLKDILPAEQAESTAGVAA